MLTFEFFMSFRNRITEKRWRKKKRQMAGRERRGEGIPCPMRRRAGDRCGWRIGGWIFRRTAGSRAHGLGPAVGQLSWRDWLAWDFV